MILNPTSLDNLKTNANGLDIINIKNIPVDFKKLNDLVCIEVLKNTKINTKDKSKQFRKEIF